jgi:microcystin degradation protein MlrC
MTMGKVKAKRSQPRIFVAGLFHETHTFLDGSTGLSDFAIKRGDEIFGCKGDGSPLGAVLEVFGDVVPGADYRAVPSAIVEDAVWEAFWNDFQNAWSPDVEGVFLVLHGAMATVSFTDVEGMLLRRIRQLPGARNLPIFGVYDLHANFSPDMARYAEALVAYRENPHTDSCESAVRAAKMMLGFLDRGEMPAMAYLHTGLVWEPTATGTTDVPMATLESLAREMESQYDFVHAVNVNAGFAYSHARHAGVSFQLVTTEPSKAPSLLEQLSNSAMEVASLARSPARPFADVLREIKTNPIEGLTLLVEPSDNIGGGAPGDGTGLLREILEAGLSNVAICINDPDAVQTLRAGTPPKLEIGGRGSRYDPGPVSLEVERVSFGEGKFRLEDPRSHLASMYGNQFDMGDCAVVRHQGITILLTSNKTPPFDLGQWRSQGVEPTGMDYVVIKAAVAHRRAYDPIAQRSFWIDTPGPCRMDNHSH